MRQSNSVLNMQNAIVNHIQRKMPKNTNNAISGRIKGSRFVTGNKSYPYVSTIEDYFTDGDYVYCILPDNGSVAAVVGVV